MLQLTTEEREVLRKKYSEGYKFLARDEDGELYVYKKEPDFTQILKYFI